MMISYIWTNIVHIAKQNGRILFLNSRIATSLCNLILIMIVDISGMTKIKDLYCWEVLQFILP